MKPLEKWQLTLFAAADEVETRGLAQGTWRDKDDRTCPIAAINAVAATPEAQRLAKLALARKIGNVIAWSDMPGRTAEEVAAMLRSTAMAPVEVLAA